MYLQIETDKTKILAKKSIGAEYSYWLYDDNLTDKYMLLYINGKYGLINYIHICHPDDFILEEIEQEFKDFYFDYDLLKTIKRTGEY